MRFPKLLICTALFAAPIAAKEKAMFPPDVEEALCCVSLAGFGEKPLWVSEQQAGYRSRLRLTTGGILRTRIMIRIDQNEKGVIKGAAVKTRDGRIIRKWKFDVSQTRLDEIYAAKGRLWTLYPETWDVSDEDEQICLDGIDILLERVDSKGYGISQGNSPCTAPQEMLDVMNKMIETAGLKPGGWWK